MDHQHHKVGAAAHDTAALLTCPHVNFISKKSRKNCAQLLLRVNISKECNFFLKMYQTALSSNLAYMWTMDQ